MKILLTCPPMLGLVEEFRPLFAARAAELVTPQVVQVLPETELLELVPQFDGWIIGDDPATRQVLTAGRKGRLRAAVKWGVGVDNVDFAAAGDLGLKIENTPRMFGREVADLAVHYVTALARHTYEIDRGVRAGAWPKPAGVSLAGKTVGIVGCGDIGANTAKRLIAAEMRAVIYDPAYKGGAFGEPASWPARLGELDFIVFTCPLNEDTRHMFSRAILPALKAGVRIVNVARGPVIEEAALIAALESGVVQSAALDVFETEPLPGESLLRGFEQCVFGSHNASNTIDATRRTSLLAIERLFALLDRGAQ